MGVKEVAMKKMMWLFIVLAFLFLGNIANADGEVDLLNLDSYSEGESVSYGKYAVVVQDELTDEKWLEQQPSSPKEGVLTIPINLSGDIEIYIRFLGHLYFNIISNENKIGLTTSIGKYYAGVNYYDWEITEFTGNDSFDSNVTSTYGAEIKLVISGRTAKLYENKDGEFLTKITLSNPNSTYTQLEVGGLLEFGGSMVKMSNRKLYELTVKSSEGTTLLNQFDKGKQEGVKEGIQQCVDDPESCDISISSDDSSSKKVSFDEGKQEGIQQCVDDPKSCGITVNQDTSSENSSNDGCSMANYYTDGILQIPCVGVPDAFGGITVYSVKMQQQPDSFTFDLDMGSVKPK